MAVVKKAQSISRVIQKKPLEKPPVKSVRQPSQIEEMGDTAFITASSSDTLTNKTFDANGTGNSLSNVEVADLAASAVVIESEGIGSNDNDTTLPTSAAVKD